MNNTLLQAVRYFTREKKIMTGMSVACGKGDQTETALDGEDVTDRSVFDLASVTKLFTGLCAVKLKEMGLLDFSRPVTDYDSRFSALKDVSAGQLMAFAVELRTPGRIDACPDRETALQCLFGTTAVGLPGRRPYSDIPAMVLKYVIEATAGMPFMTCVRRLILEKADMEETWALVPEKRLKDCQSYDCEHRIEKGRYILRSGLKTGVPHDPKAAVIQGGTDDLCGHAGLFSTRGDMVRFCRAVLAGKIVSAEGLREIAVNRTGRELEDGTHTQYLGYQCYVRHPNQYYSEIPAYMGCRAFGNGGFTGNHTAIDPERGIFTVFLGNRVKNRLTVLLPEDGKELEDYGLNADGSGFFLWKDGEKIPSSVKYVHQKDAHLHMAVAEVLGLDPVPFGS